MKALLLFILLSFIQFLGAQSLPQKANEFLRKGETGAARKTIDTLFAQTKEVNAQGWLLKADIYFAYFRSAEAPDHAIDSLQSTVKMYANACTGNVETRTEAFDHIRMNASLLINDGVDFFNGSYFQQAYKLFLISENFSELVKDTVPLTAYNIALAAERLGLLNEALYWYERSEMFDYQGATCCARIVKLLSELGDETAFEARLKECRTQYPNEYNLLVNEINYCVSKDLHREAIPLLRQVLKVTPNDYYLHYMLANSYSVIGDFMAAEESYTRCLQLNPTFIDGYYNLGTLYFNKGVGLHTQLADESDPQKYLALEKDYKHFMRTALISLEMAFTERKESELMETLLVIYELLDMREDQEAMKQQLINQK